MIKYLSSLHKAVIAIIGSTMLVLIGIIDLITGVEYSSAIFYLIPISFITWYIGNKSGLLFSLLSSFAWLIGDISAAERYMNVTAPYWNAIVRLCFFLIFVILITQIKKYKIELETKIEEKTRDLKNEIQIRKKTESKLQNKTKKLSELANKLLIMQDEQSFHIARELHDELGQAMTAIKIDLMWLSKRYSIKPEIVESLFSISQTVNDAIATIRHISSSLRPRLLDELGFIPAVERYLKEYFNKTGINYFLHYDNERYDIDNIEKNALFRILQESLTNIARHSKANRIDIDVKADNSNKIVIQIKDNGVGLAEGYESKRNTLGIIGMIERAEAIGGYFAISSQSNSGTIVKINLPLKIKND